MFTGIIQSLGSITQSVDTPDGLRLTIDMGSLDPAGISLGDSVAVNGACLTVTDIKNNQLQFDVSSETLEKCLIGEWQDGDKVNLELALTLQTPLGGHLVSGHVDGKGQLLNREESEEYTRMEFKTQKSIGRFIAVKGSVSVDGVSLTTNLVTDNNDQTIFEVMLVPHTLSHTTLGTMQVGDQVHLEIDIVARYLQRLIEADQHSLT